MRADSSQTHLVLHTESPGKPAGSGDPAIFGSSLGTLGKYIATPAKQSLGGYWEGSQDKGCKVAGA